MTDIKYLDEAVRLAGFEDWCEAVERESVRICTSIRTTAAVLEQAAQFRQEVSDEALRYKQWRGPTHHKGFDRFILPAPDPLESWLHKSGYEGNSVVEQALADLTKSGGKIVWEAGE